MSWFVYIDLLYVWRRQVHLARHGYDSTNKVEPAGQPIPRGHPFCYGEYGKLNCYGTLACIPQCLQQSSAHPLKDKLTPCLSDLTDDADVVGSLV